MSLLQPDRFTPESNTDDAAVETTAWFSRSRVLLAIAGLVFLGALALLSAPLQTGETLPTRRLGGLVLLVIAALLAAAPGLLLRDLRAALAGAFSRGGRAYLAAALVITVIAAAVRLTLIGLPAGYDESVTFLTFVAAPLNLGLSSYPFPNNHFLNTLLMHIAWRGLGDDLEVLRLPALVAGIALIPAMYIAGSVLYNRTVGVVAAALAVPSGVLVEYSVNARGYSMVALATVVLVPLGLYAVRRSSGAAWVLWAGVAALGMWTIPTFLYPLAVIVVWLVGVILLDLDRPRWRASFLALEHAVLGTIILTLVLWQPAYGEAGLGYSEAQVPPGFLGIVWRAFETGYGAAWWLIAAAVVAAAALHRRISPIRAPLWGAMLIVLPIATLASDRVPPFVRTWIWVLPLLLLFAAAGLVAVVGLVLERRPLPRLRPAAVVVPVLFAALTGAAVSENDIFTSDDPPAHGAEQAVAYMRDHMQTGDGIAVGTFAGPQFTYYFRRAGLNPSFVVGPQLGLVVPAPTRRFYTAIIESRIPTIQQAAAYLAPLQRSRLVEQADGGSVYVSPPLPRPKPPKPAKARKRRK